MAMPLTMESLEHMKLAALGVCSSAGPTTAVFQGRVVGRGMQKRV